MVVLALREAQIDVEPRSEESATEFITYIYYLYCTFFVAVTLKYQAYFQRNTETLHCL